MGDGECQGVGADDRIELGKLTSRFILLSPLAGPASHGSSFPWFEQLSPLFRLAAGPHCQFSL